MIEDFFEFDKKTAYIFTSDHGMTDWGSHGAGLNQETDCPIIAWGAGISKAIFATSKEYYDDGYSEKWHLSHIRRLDIMQADVTPLAASLIGIPIPVNSVGILPISYLNTSHSYLAECMLVNAKEIIAQFKIKMEQRSANTLSIFYKQFRQLKGDTADNWIYNLTRLYDEGRYADVVSSSRTLAYLGIEGLHYYHNYDRPFLSIMIAGGFIGWILYVILFTLKSCTNVDVFKIKGTGVMEKFSKIDSAFLVISLIAFVVIFVQRSPATHYIYVMIPSFFWSQILKERRILFERIRNMGPDDILYILVLFLCIELLVFSFFYRICLTIALAFLGIWPLTTNLIGRDKFLCGYWLIACFLVGLFPSLPVVGRTANYIYVNLTGILTVLIGMSITFSRFNRKASSIFIIQLILASLAVIIVNNTATSINHKHGLPLLNQIFSWLILCTSWMLPLFSSSFLFDRLLSLFLSCMATYILFSTSYEAFFCLCFCNLIAAWIAVEQKLSTFPTESLLEIYFENRKPRTRTSLEDIDSIERNPISAHLRLAYFFVLFIVVAFFGTGNIASINSFDPMTVSCFLTIFSPFTMGALLICKILIPFIMVMSALYTLQIILRIPIKFLLFVVLTMTDLMAMHFFFMIRDQGSWLDIGTSISHYVIMMLVIISLVSLFGVTSWLISYSPTQLKTKHQ